MLAPGYVIGGRYRLVRLLGEGGMGVVWSAVNDSFGREVAIKIMLPGVASGDPTAIDRFFTEARICGTIRHPGIVDVLDVGKAENGAPFLVMELLDGDSLDNILHKTGTLRPLEILPVIRDVARTLGLAHDKGVIHRDVKPGNVFLHRLPDGQVVAKVLDFGVSKVNDGSTPTSRTRTGMVVGSPAYMSPEQAGGRLELDPRSDVYALGVILYEALAGRLPFLEQNYNALMIDIAVTDPPSLASVAPRLPKPVYELVKAAMVHDREGRIPSAAALADRIEATILALGASATHALPDPAALCAGASPPSSRATSSAQTSSALASSAGVRPRRRRSNVPWLALGLAAVFGSLAGLGLVWFQVARRPAAPAPVLAAPASVEAPPAEPAPPVSVAASASARATASGTVVAPSSATAPPSITAPTVPRRPGGKGGSGKQKGVWTYD